MDGLPASSGHLLTSRREGDRIAHSAPGREQRDAACASSVLRSGSCGAISTMRVALAQINTTVGDLEGNLARIRAAAAEARRRGAEVVVFPEMVLTSYPPRDLLLRESFVEAQIRALHDLAREASDLTLVVGFVSRNESGAGKALRNSAAVLADGRVKDVRHKSLLPTYDVFDERRYFEPASRNEPISLLGRRVGLTICEDAWALYDGPGALAYARDPVQDLARRGVDLVVNISASPFTLGKPAIRTALLCGHARAARAPVLYVNQVGGNDELVFDGASQVIGPDGAPRAWGAAFAEDLLIVDVDALPPEAPLPPEDEAEAIRRAVVLGLRDFVRKCGFERVVLGMSGGADSSVVAALAAEALGPENVTGVAMPSMYSAPASREDAETLARNLGIRFEVIPIGPPFDAMRAALGRHLADERAADVALQNLQARLRGTILMALSNRYGWMLLATGNKSELATGYCTLYGDMCGALAPIGDVLKTQVYAVAGHINREQPVIPERVLTRAPSAELKPNQTDQDSLPPYEVLDGILRICIEEERVEVEELVRRGFRREDAVDTLWRIAASEHKRRQAPPCLKVTSRAFGYGRRLPIARKIGPEGG